MANVGMTGRGTMIVNGVEMPLPSHSIGTMTITGDGIWIDGVKQDPTQQTTSEDGKVVNLYFAAFENCKIDRLEFKHCRIPEGVRFNECEVKRVSTTTSSVHVIGNVTGDVDSRSGTIECDGNIEGSAKSASGDIRCGGDIGGSASSMSGDISAKTINGDASSMSGDVSGKSSQRSAGSSRSSASSSRTYVNGGRQFNTDFGDPFRGGTVFRNVAVGGVAEVSGGAVFINGIRQNPTTNNRSRPKK